MVRTPPGSRPPDGGLDPGFLGSGEQKVCSLLLKDHVCKVEVMIRLLPAVGEEVLGQIPICGTVVTIGIGVEVIQQDGLTAVCLRQFLGLLEQLFCLAGLNL